MANKALQLALKLGFLSVRYVLKWVSPSNVSIMLLAVASLPSDLKHTMVFAVSSTSAMKQGARFTLMQLSESILDCKRTETNSTSLFLEGPGKHFDHLT